MAEATALLDWRLAPVWQRARAELAKHTRKPDQEWVRMLWLMETHPASAIERAVTAALGRHSPRLETVRLILRQQEAGPPPVCPPRGCVSLGCGAVEGAAKLHMCSPTGADSASWPGTAGSPLRGRHRSA